MLPLADFVGFLNLAMLEIDDILTGFRGVSFNDRAVDTRRYLRVGNNNKTTQLPDILFNQD